MAPVPIKVHKISASDDLYLDLSTYSTARRTDRYILVVGGHTWHDHETTKLLPSIRILSQRPFKKSICGVIHLYVHSLQIHLYTQARPYQNSPALPSIRR